MSEKCFLIIEFFRLVKVLYEYFPYVITILILDLLRYSAIFSCSDIDSLPNSSMSPKIKILFPLFFIKSILSIAKITEEGFAL